LSIPNLPPIASRSGFHYQSTFLPPTVTRWLRLSHHSHCQSAVITTTSTIVTTPSLHHSIITHHRHHYLFVITGQPSVNTSCLFNTTAMVTFHSHHHISWVHQQFQLSSRSITPSLCHYRQVSFAFSHSAGQPSNQLFTTAALSSPSSVSGAEFSCNSQFQQPIISGWSTHHYTWLIRSSLTFRHQSPSATVSRQPPPTSRLNQSIVSIAVTNTCHHNNTTNTNARKGQLTTTNNCSSFSGSLPSAGYGQLVTNTHYRQYRH